MTPRAQHPARTALIVEENLGRTSGHYESWVDGIATAFQREGLDVTVLGSRNAHRLAGGIPIEPWFERNYMDAYLAVPPRIAPRLLAALGHNLRFFRQLRKWFTGRPGYDLVMATHVNIFHLLAWRLVWTLFGRRKIRRLVVNSLVPMWLYEHDNTGVSRRHKGAWLLGLIYRTFSGPVSRGEVQLTAETEYDARAIEAVSGVPVMTLPTPRPESLIVAARRRISERRAGHSQPPVLGWLGRCSEEKGFSHFFEACRQFLAANPETPCTILIQYLVSPEGCRIPESEIDELAASDPRVRLIKSSVFGDAYGRLLGELDCLILPYLRRYYVGRNSSAALDAVLAGIPIITTEGTWMAELMARHGAGLSCKDANAAALAEAIGELIENDEIFAATALRRCETARDAISWTRFSEALNLTSPSCV